MGTDRERVVIRKLRVAAECFFNIKLIKPKKEGYHVWLETDNLFEFFFVIKSTLFLCEGFCNLKKEDARFLNIGLMTSAGCTARHGCLCRVARYY